MAVEQALGTVSSWHQPLLKAKLSASVQLAGRFGFLLLGPLQTAFIYLHQGSPQRCLLQVHIATWL